MPPDPDPLVDPSPARLGALLEEFRPRLARMVELRMDPRLRRRCEVSDVLQEAFVDVARRLDEYRASPAMPFFLWVRFLAGQKLLELHRRHLETGRRARDREISPRFPAVSSVSMAQAVLDSAPSPSDAVARAEEQQRLQEALGALDEGDREILVLRYFEHLSNEEAAHVLGLTSSGAKQRHLQAVRRLKASLGPLLRVWETGGG